MIFTIKMGWLTKLGFFLLFIRMGWLTKLGYPTETSILVHVVKVEGRIKK